MVLQSEQKCRQTKEGSGHAKKEDGTEKRYLPKKAWEQMSEKEKEETDQKKQEGSKEGKQHVANTQKVGAFVSDGSTANSDRTQRRRTRARMLAKRTRKRMARSRSMTRRARMGRTMTSSRRMTVTQKKRRRMVTSRVKMARMKTTRKTMRASVRKMKTSKTPKLVTSAKPRTNNRMARPRSRGATLLQARLDQSI